jgi:putative restriction endonuclease
MRVSWSDEELLIAAKLYCELPFGKLHSNNPSIIHYAGYLKRTPASLAMKLANFASLDPVILNSGRKGLSGASKADRKVWNEMNSNWEEFLNKVEKLEENFDIHKEMDMDLDVSETEISDGTLYEGLTNETTIKARKRQAFFRKSVLSAYDYKCCITGLEYPKLLIASHIKPWKSDPLNRLNPYNGLCLSALHDRAFDLGLITVNNQFRVKISPAIKNIENLFFKAAMLDYEDSLLKLPDKFRPNIEFLHYHQNYVFIAA